MVHLARHVWFLADASVIGSQNINIQTLEYPMNFEPLLSHSLLTLLIMKAEDLPEVSGPALPAVRAHR